MLRVKRPRTTQPKGPVPIDWKNPLTRGLVFADNPVVGFNEVNGVRPWVQTTRRVPAGHGVAYSIESSAALYHDYWQLMPLGSSNSNSVFLQATPYVAGDTFLSFGDSEGYVGFEYGISTGGYPNIWASAGGGWTEDLVGSIQLTAGVAEQFLYTYDDPTGALVGYHRNAIYTGTGGSGAGHQDTLTYAAYIEGGGGGYSGRNDTKVGLVLIWDRVLSAAEAKAILANPWQIYMPEELPYFPSVVVTVQTAFPIADVSNTGWTPSSGSDLYPMIGEAVRNDSTYIYATVPGAICEEQLTVLGDPDSSVDHLPTLVLSAPGGGGITVRLREGTTTIATWTYYPPGTATEYQPTLTGTEINSITNYAALTYQIEAIA